MGLLLTAVNSLIGGLQASKQANKSRLDTVCVDGVCGRSLSSWPFSIACSLGLCSFLTEACSAHTVVVAVDAVGGGEFK